MRRVPRILRGSINGDRRHGNPWTPWQPVHRGRETDFRVFCDHGCLKRPVDYRDGRFPLPVPTAVIASDPKGQGSRTIEAGPGWRCGVPSITHDQTKAPMALRCLSLLRPTDSTRLRIRFVRARKGGGKTSLSTVGSAGALFSDSSSDIAIRSFCVPGRPVAGFRRRRGRWCSASASR